MSNVKEAVGKRMLVTQLSVASESIIYMPDATVQKTFLGIIKLVGKNVSDKETLYRDRICMFNPYTKEKGRKPNDWFFKESDIILIKKGANYHPFGRRVLIKRLNNTEIVKGGIIIPTAYKSSDQTLFGVVFSKGISKNNIIDANCEVGDIVKIQKWDKEIK